MPFERFLGKVVLIANTASKCGFTPQYADLQRLYEMHKAAGLEVLAFPTNDFGGQDPGSNKEIQTFCTGKFKVTFPLFAKVTVLGANKHPFFQYLTEAGPEQTKGEIEWNFEKFLLDRSGKLRYRFGSHINPLNHRITEKVEELLSEVR